MTSSRSGNFRRSDGLTFRLPKEVTDSYTPTSAREVETTFDFEDGNGPVPAHQHPNGGGWVADTATVDDTAHVGPHARVFNTARVEGGARVYSKAQVGGKAQVEGNARVHGSALVWGTARVAGSTWVGGDTEIDEGVHISGVSE